MSSRLAINDTLRFEVRNTHGQGHLVSTEHGYRRIRESANYMLRVKCLALDLRGRRRTAERTTPLGTNSSLPREVENSKPEDAVTNPWHRGLPRERLTWA